MPGDDFEVIEFDSHRSLLDADIVLIEIGFGGIRPSETHEGLATFPKHSSPIVKRSLDHWRSEITMALSAGKLGIAFLSKPETCCYYNGEFEYSGTGRNRVKTSHLGQINSYSALLPGLKAESKSGDQMRLVGGLNALASYWKEFGSMHIYEAFISGESIQPLIQTQAGAKVVGARIHKHGTLLLLPNIVFQEGIHCKYEGEYNIFKWTNEAQKFAKRYSAALLNLYAQFQETGSRTPPPAWATNDVFLTPEETQLQYLQFRVEAKLGKLENDLVDLIERKREAGSIRGLLFEQGKALEKSVLEALTLFGFTAEGLQENDSEFDAVFACKEGRFIGEVEGKDTKALNIDKLSQLERNIQEDYERDEVDVYAKGVLFGNAQRLVGLEERGEFFTQKCMTGAKRAGVALVRTPDLFEPAVYLRNYKNASYAKACRNAIIAATGEVVQFPAVPVQMASPLAP